MIDAVFDAKNARRILRRYERAVGKAGREALARAGENARKAYISGLKRGNTLAMRSVGKVPLRNAKWTRLLHPGSKLAGILGEKFVWRIMIIGYGVKVDIVDRLRPLLERWQFGGGDRPAQLQSRVLAWQTIPEARRRYHILARRNPKWPQNPDTLPEVSQQPQRDVVTHVQRFISENAADWYLTRYIEIATGKKPTKKEKEKAS